MNVLVLDKDVDPITTAMIRSGLVHLISVADVQHWADQGRIEAVPHEEPRHLAEISTMARSLAEKLGVDPDEVDEAAAFQSFDPFEAKRTLKEILNWVEPVLSERRTARRKLASLRQARQQAPLDILSEFGIDPSARYTMLEVAIGLMRESNIGLLKSSLSSVPNVVLTFPDQKGKVSVMTIVLKKDREVLREALEKAGFEEVRSPKETAALSADVDEQLGDRIRQAEAELQRAEHAVARCSETHLPTIRRILSQVSLHQLARSARENFRKTARTYLITGWTPRSTRQRVFEALRKACGNRCIIEDQSAEEILAGGGERVDVPVVFENPRLLKPFELLVSGYGPPAYDSLEPTAIVAPTFLLMYGAMFGDVGQGGVLAILGFLLSRAKTLSENVRRIGQLLMWCGASAVLFGFLYGSVFGFRNLLPYRGFEPVENVNALLTIALFFGMTMITLGLVCNAITAISRKQWTAGLLEWRGLMGVAFYWVAVALITRVLSGKSENGLLLAVLIIMPFMAAVLGGVLQRESRTDRRPSGGDLARRVLRSLGHMIGGFLETVLQFFTNTMSFLRVAAFAMAHAALFIAVFSLADVLRGGGLALPLLIHVLGNAGMIALEGLVVCVQALRLEYYEFFGKFFRVGKTEFAPVRLRSTPPS